MSRLTKNEPRENSNFPYQLKDKELRTELDAIHKLGQLEDIEDELGIDLVTLFKALKQNYVYVRTNVGIEKNKGFNICGLELWSQIKLNPKDYGKTWALTKEELL